MRRLPLLALLLAASVHAQASLEITSPLLLLDGQRLQVSGPPLYTSAFETLEMEIPGWGTLVVSDAPFDGARRAGDFEGTRLILVAAGRSVRLRSGTPLLTDSRTVPAYARLVTSPHTPLEGPVYLRLESFSGPEPPPLTVPPPSDPVGPSLDSTVPLPAVSGVSQELVRQLETLRAERDDLRASLARSESERDNALLRLVALREEVERLRFEMSGLGPSEQQLRQERDALREEVALLRASLAALGTPAAQPPETTMRRPPEEMSPVTSSARLSLPGFDLARLRNADQIQARLQSEAYPAWAQASAIGGEVLVLFQTDASGAVVRTAVPRPIGGGLDALAEEIVRSMQFIPARADGQPTGLRSQVVVRFTP